MVDFCLLRKVCLLREVGFLSVFPEVMLQTVCRMGLNLQNARQGSVGSGHGK